MKMLWLALGLALNVHAAEPVTSDAMMPEDATHAGMATSAGSASPKANITPERAEAVFLEHAAAIDDRQVRRLAVQNNGRVKPFDTLAREVVLFANGAYGRWGLSPTQIYLNFIVDETSVFLPFIEVRSLELREQLGAMRTQRFFSMAELENSSLQALSEPLIQKQQENPKGLNEHEKKVLETFSQYQLMRNVQSGDHFIQSIDFTFLNGHGRHTADASETAAPTSNRPLQETAKAYLQSIVEPTPDSVSLAPRLVELTRAQAAPEIMQHGLSKLDTEIFYNDSHLFLWASLLALVLGFAILMPPVSRRLSDLAVGMMALTPLMILATALGLRIYITRFAPVTNMYTTMIWVALGVLVFSQLLFTLYRNRSVSGIMLLGCGAILLLTEKTPLVLSPDMDPIVAVLRSNYWLSTHVTTITISYAAFTIAMILGNVALVRVLFFGVNAHNDTAFVKEYSHYAYRMIQLGCFLLTTGIILGGIWADYSWGRFWGWDPKETWALIADLGFLAILHARFAGWARDFTLLACCPVAYLLIIMAWYGVNFILAAGLHSYGFSSGGTMMILSFLALQLGLLAAAFVKLKFQGRSA